MNEKDKQLDGELEEIFNQYFQDKAVNMTVSAIEVQNEQDTKEVKQEKAEEIYSFINSEYLHQDSIEGLIPRNGANSKSIQDDKKAIFYSQGKEGAIVMYFEFLRQYDNFKGERGNKALQEYENYKNGKLELNEKKAEALKEQVKQIYKARETQNFDEYMGEKLYLKLDGIDIETDKQAADEWRKAHIGTRMDYNYANSWTNSAIPPDKLEVVSIQNKNNTDVKTSQKDVIKYFLSQTNIDKIEELGVNDTTLEIIKKYYIEHDAEIAKLGKDYSLVTQNIQEFEQIVESNKEKIRESEMSNVMETEKQEDRNLPAQQDNSFIGKVRRVFSNMKNKDNSKGFFERLKDSVKNVFGNKENNTYDNSSNENQNNIDTKQEQQNDIFYKVDVNPLEAVNQTLINSRKNQTITKTEYEKDDIKQDDLIQ